jgi:hypothetical protein
VYLLGNVVMITTDADWSMASNADGRSGTLDMASYCTALPRGQRQKRAFATLAGH